MRSGILGLIVLMAAPSFADDPDAKVAWEALRGEYQEATAAWEALYNNPAAETSSSEYAIARYRDWPAWDFAPRFVALAERHIGTPEAFDALVLVVELGRAVSAADVQLRPSHERAIALILEHHRDDPKLEASCRDIARAFSPRGERALRTLADEARLPAVRLQARYRLADMLITRRRIAQAPWYERTSTPFPQYIKERTDPAFFRYIRETNLAATAREIAGLLETVIADDLADAALKKWSERNLFAIRNLEVGQVAPEIVGKDLGGDELRLGDFRGQVVVLSFCDGQSGRSETFRAAERALLSRFEGKPVVVLEVNADDDKTKLPESIAKGDVTWRCWIDGGLDGPITSRWVLQKFPTACILDADCVIRAKDLDADGLETAVIDALKPARP